MKWISVFMLLAVTATAQPALKLHHKAVVVDTHNDFPSVALNKGVSLDMALKGLTHTDLQRMQQGGLDVQIFSIWCDGERQQPFAWANREIDSVHAWARRNPQKLSIAGTPKLVKQAVKKGQIALMMGVEGGHMIENDLSKLEALYNRGVRYMTLTWNNSTNWATSAADETNPNFSGAKGLSGFGKEVVRKMNKLGMLVDLSHVGEQTFNDVMATTNKPVLVSHSCVHNICPVARNLKDEQIRAIGKNGGVIHLNFFPGFVDSSFMPKYMAFLQKHQPEIDAMAAANPQMDKDYISMIMFEKYPEEVKNMRPPLSALLNHLDFIVNLIGVNHVGLGSDFDGIPVAPIGLDGVENFPEITAALLQRGYSKKDIKKILGGNFIRLMKAIQP